MPISAFVDSDVIISSLLSHTGASHMLLEEVKIKKFISTLSRKELALVVPRLQLDNSILEERLSTCEVIPLDLSVEQIKEDYKQYVTDSNDAHIVAGAVSANVQFLITYNMKDFLIDRIKDKLGIIVLTPGQFLQYLRSI